MGKIERVRYEDNSYLVRLIGEDIDITAKHTSLNEPPKRLQLFIEHILDINKRQTTTISKMHWEWQESDKQLKAALAELESLKNGREASEGSSGED